MGACLAQLARHGCSHCACMEDSHKEHRMGTLELGTLCVHHSYPITSTLPTSPHHARAGFSALCLRTRAPLAKKSRGVVPYLCHLPLQVLGSLGAKICRALALRGTAWATGPLGEEPNTL